MSRRRGGVSGVGPGQKGGAGEGAGSEEASVARTGDGQPGRGSSLLLKSQKWNQT